MRPVLKLAALLSSLALSALSRPARAQDASQKASAEALFLEARNLLEAGRAAEACPKLEASQKLDPQLGTLLNLADCYERLGRTASAWALFREAEVLAQKRQEEERARVAKERVARLEQRLSRLIIHVPAAGHVPGLVVRRNGQPVDPAAWGAAVPVDPGKQTIEASAPGRRTWRTSVRVGSGPVTASVEVRPPAVEVRTPAVEADRPAKRQGRGRRRSPVRAVLLGGSAALAVGGIAVGAVYGIKASRAWNDSRDLCDGTACTSEEGAALTRDAARFADVATVAFAAGVAAASAAAILWWTWPRGELELEVGFSPADQEGSSFTLSGRF